MQSIEGRYAIEVFVKNTETHQYEWRQLKPSGRDRKPYRFNNIDKAYRVMETCYPEGGAKVIEVLRD